MPQIDSSHNYDIHEKNNIVLLKAPGNDQKNEEQTIQLPHLLIGDERRLK